MDHDYAGLIEDLSALYAERDPRSAALDRRARAVMVDGGNHNVRLNRPFPPRIAAARGALPDRRRRPPTAGLLAGALRHHPRARHARRGEGRGRGARGGERPAARHGRRADRGDGRAALPARARGEGALHHERYAGHDVRRHAGAGVHRAPAGREGRRRLARRPALGPQGRRLPPRTHALDGRERGTAGGGRGRGRDRPLQRPRRPRRAVRPSRRRGRLPHRRAHVRGRELHGRHSRVPRPGSRAQRAARGVARLRRGDQRLPLLRGRSRRAATASAPTCSTLGKIIGGGMPVAAVAGRADVLGLCGREGHSRVMFSGGTYSAHPASMLAARTMLSYLVEHEAEIYPRLAILGDRLRRAIEEGFAAEGVLARCSGAPVDCMPGSSLAAIHFPYDPATAVDRPHVTRDPALFDIVLKEQRPAARPAGRGRLRADGKLRPEHGTQRGRHRAPRRGVPRGRATHPGGAVSDALERRAPTPAGGLVLSQG